ncbi:SDR family oxidoreductase [Variovorax sp. KBS0712]|uniref:SDR family NAD(P)-dependent oxidoreductase n=1 Tax=Variovorax sp. KBS0712 TaxID=2578111 RepID=UPI00111BA7F8|nr:SDR family NAD(P)-dependent oxidoreductase [Variovorax sp. KBS0712]TSD56001.1 SDR family oxidoreductase [Variovorax sp. KBS0712]
MTHATALPLAGRVAFVTGAGQGLGAAIARALAQAGARVAVADIDQANAQAVAAEVNGLALPLDVRDEQAFGDRFAQAVEHFGAVDILVNNAARTPTTSLWDITPAEWDDVLAINLRGSFFGSRIAGRQMRARGAGRIVNLASLAGQQVSSATGVHYAASKAGLLALTRAFAQELAPHGVTVNALAPAAIDSPALAALPPERQQALKAGIPLGRFGLADEVAAAVVYLASPAAAFMTGATLDLNGGRFMR